MASVADELAAALGSVDAFELGLAALLNEIERRGRRAGWAARRTARVRTLTHTAWRYIMKLHMTGSTAITPVILGLLALAPRSGYDIKSVVDRSTRFFWAASYGQIYPELRRLEQGGLIEGEESPTGGRRRRIHRLTPAGHEALIDWLLGREVTIELRDESLLRLFFADALPHEQALSLLEGRKRGHEAYLEVLRAIDDRPGEDPPFVDLVLRWGLDFNEWGARWCEEQLERLSTIRAA
jgi:PadR family transcriptional regulator, regulatory protein AphA